LDSPLADFHFVCFLQPQVLHLGVRVRATVRVKVRFKVYLLRLVRINQAYCTLIVRYCYVTGGVVISFPISRKTGISVATA